MPKRRESLCFGARDLPIHQFRVPNFWCRVVSLYRTRDWDSEPLGSSGDGLKAESVGQRRESAGADPARSRIVVARFGCDGSMRHQVANARVSSKDELPNLQGCPVLGVGDYLIRATEILR